MKQKIYCYVDETGQDTKGEFFLVSVVLKDKEQLAKLQRKLEKVEQSSGKNLVKWFKATFPVRQAYLSELLKIKELQDAIYYSNYHNTTEYTALMALAIAKSILSKTTPNADYTATIIIDALNDAENERIRQELKKLAIHYRKIRGMKDEQDAMLRLADCMAGFLRDYIENQRYAKKLMPQFFEAKMVKEI